MLAPVLTKNRQTKTRPLRLGFVPLSDCAPLIMAKELGLFAKYGIDVELRREIGWASLRDKICYGELDAAHALAPLLFAMGLGIGAPARDCVSGLILSLEGNGVTLSRHFFKSGVTDRASLRKHLQKSRKPLLLGIPFLYSSHHFLLRAFLIGLGVNPASVAQFVVVPPPQMPAHLRDGTLDGYCVGEPWNSAAVLARSGWLIATSADLEPGHPEKVLLVRRDFAEEHADEHVALAAALLEACQFCAAPESGARIAETLARRDYINIAAKFLIPTFGGIEVASGQAMQRGAVFFGDGVNEPSEEKAAWIVEQLQAIGMGAEFGSELAEVAARGFRKDIYDQALRLRQRLNAHREEHTQSALELALN